VTDARRQAIDDSNRRWRTIFGALAVVVPFALGALFLRQASRLAALADHGREATATMTAKRDGGSFYTYEVEGKTYDWNVRAADAPYPVGARFSVTYLPEDPSLSRPVFPYAPTDVEPPRGLVFGLPAGLFIFFAGASLLCHRALLRSRAGLPATARKPISPVTSGRWVAGLLLACVLAADLDPKVRALFRTLWGESLLGLPVIIPIGLGQALLFAPAFWVMPELMRIVQARLAAGGSVGKLGILIAVATAGPELRRARNVVIAGGVYFAVLLASWIAYAAHRGV
jgi:hypothetical protein